MLCMICMTLDLSRQIDPFPTLYDLYDLHDLYDLPHVAGCEPSLTRLIDLARFLGWNCVMQLLHNLSQQQVRNYMI